MQYIYILCGILCLLFISTLDAQTLHKKQDVVNVAKNHPAYHEGYIRCYTDDTEQERRRRNPNMQTPEDFESWMQSQVNQYKKKTSNQRAVVYTIPTVFHIVHDSGNGVGTGDNLSAAVVQAQIDQMNDDFRRRGAGANTDPVGTDVEIEFCLATLNPADAMMTEPGINRIDHTSGGFTAPPFSTNYIDGTIKPATQWNPDLYFNIWVCNISGGVLGYAQFPEAPTLGGVGTGNGAANTDGCVMLHTSLGSVANPSGDSPYDKGRTSTHEVGHWLGLRHIWGDTDCSGDDFCNDTPNSDASNFGCPTTHVSCGSTDMVQNYMDYTDDDCMNVFTVDQATRMRIVMGETGEGSPRRASLTNSPKCGSVDDFLVTVDNDAVSVCSPDDATYSIDVTFVDNYSDPVTLGTTGLPAGATATFSPTVLNATGASTLTISGTGGINAGVYTFDVIGMGTTGARTVTVTLTVSSGAPEVVSLSTPANGAIDVSTTASLSWDTSVDATSYEIEVSTDLGFSTGIITYTSPTPNTTTTGLSNNTQYFWRVKSVNDCDMGAWSTVWDFTTQDITPCTDFATGPYIDFNPIPSACFNNCTPVTQTFNVWQNEAYVFYNMAAGEEYTFSHCDGYDAAVWESLLTVAEFDAITSTAGAVISSILDCSITFTVPANGDYILVIANQNDCGGSEVQTDNGIPTLICTGLTACCGAVFTDPGGVNSLYPNNGNATYTICPDSPTQTVEVNFSSFSLEDNANGGCWDQLSAYEGTSAAGTLIADYCDAPGSTPPTIVTAPNAGDCLTFVFTSDGTTNQDGWVANVNCIEGNNAPCTINILDPVLNSDCNGPTYFIEIYGIDSNADDIIFTVAGDGGFITSINATNLGNGDFHAIVSGIPKDEYLTIWADAFGASCETNFIEYANNPVPPLCTSCDIFGPLCAGDTNHDNVVDYNDLLTLGVKHGRIGCPRPDAHTDWIPQAAPDWEDIYPDGIDAKHADCNGDGLVDNSEDAPIIRANYGLTHDGDDVYILENFVGDAIVQSHWRNPSTAPSTIELDVHLEHLVGSNVELYGIGFSLDFSEIGINPSLSAINSVMGQEGQDLYVFSKDLGNGKMDVALTRLDGTPIITSPTNDYLGTITFQVNGNSDKNEFHLRFHNIKIINEVGMEVEPILGSSASAVFGIGSSFNATSPMFIHGAYIEDCNQGTIAKVIPSGGTAPYTYQWSNGSTTQQTDIFTVGIHRITITDANNISTIGRVRIYGDCQVILPLEWLDFSARAQASNIILDWTTANEVDIEKYDIQRSTDGIHFETVGSISSKNNHQNKYQWIDKTAQFNTLYYYQIRSVEEDGKFNLSAIEAVQLEQTLEAISIKPNPTINKAILFLNGSSTHTLDLSIYNQLGQQVFEAVYPSENRQIELDLGEYDNGVYFIKVHQNQQVYMSKIIKQ